MKSLKNNYRDYSYKDHKEKSFAKPKVKTEYDALQPEYDIIRAMTDARLSQNITQKELAVRTGITQADISRIENGTRSKKRDQMVEGDFSGYFLKIQKGKELEIHHQDTIVDYKYFLKKKFLYRNVIGAEDREGKYKEYVNRQGLQEIVNEVFYSKWLTGNYFTPEDEMSIDGELKRILIWSREAVFAWLYKGREVGMDRILHTVAKNVIKESIKNGYMGKVVQQFNLMCSFDEYFGGCNMADRYSEIREKLRDKINCRGEQIIESEEEYFYAVGQLVRYYISLSKAKEKTHSLANPFFNATSNEVLQTRLKQYFMKYNHEIATRSSRFNYMYGMVLGYELEGKIRQEPIIAGYLSNSLFYESSKKEMEET